MKALLAVAASLAIGSVARADPPLLPLEQLTAAPLFWNAQLSPDGRRISYVAISKGAPNLWVAPAGNLQAGIAVTAADGQGVTTSNVAGHIIYRWTADSRKLLYLQDRNGDERWHLMLTDANTGVARDLTPIDDVQVRLVAIGTQHPEEALVEINDRRPDRHDLYRINLTTAARERVYRNDRFIGFFADNRLRPRLAVAGSDDGGFDILKFVSGDWRPFIHLAQEDTSALIRAVEQNAWHFTADDRRLVIYDSRGRDTWAIVEIDVETGAVRALASDDRVDVDSALYDSAGDLEAWRANWCRPQWQSRAATMREELQLLQSRHEGDLAVVSRSQNGSRWLVSYTSSHRSPEFYLYQRDTRRLAHLATQIPAINQLTLPQLKPVVIPSRDGFQLVSYLLLPRGSDTEGDGTPHSPLPMVIYVHGGPNDERAEYGYSARLQWLANRGYAVLNVNYRGSPGFGKRFLNAQNLEWGNKMNLDVVDHALWAAKEGIADPHRIGILGGSYGGYEVLAAMTKTPGVFACGTALAAPSDLESFIGIWWENFIPATNMAYKSIVLGDPQTEAGRAALRASSPIHFAQQARGALFIAQGGEDTRVPTQQAQLMVDALVRAKVPVTYALYPDEGHGVVRPGNRKSFYALTEAFFGGCLGGHSAPIADALRDANVRIPVGAEHIPGLPQAHQQSRDGT